MPGDLSVLLPRRWGHFRGRAAGALERAGRAVPVDKLPTCGAGAHPQDGHSDRAGRAALLLLKGLSHKVIAEVRATSERTVRQQALAVYRKAGLAGRAELAAFFLEDLLLPGGGGRAPPSGGGSAG